MLLFHVQRKLLLRKNGDSAKLVVDFSSEKHNSPKKSLKSLRISSKKSYNNSGNSWKSSRILRVKRQPLNSSEISSFFFIFVSSFSFNMWQIVHNIDTDICTLTQSLPCCCLSCCFFSCSAYPQTDKAQLYNTHPDSCTHMDRTALEFNLSFVSSQNKNSSHCHLVIIHGSGASPFETAGLSRPQIYEDATGLRTITERHGERTFLELRWRMQSVTQIYDCEECAVAMHVPPFKGTAQGKFKVLDGTDPTPSMPMLVANGNRVVYRVEELITAKGVAAPLTSDGDDWHLKVLINNENVFIRIDVCTACHECPPCWVRCLSRENVERRTTPASTTITKTRKDFEVKNSSNPEQTGAAGKLRNTQTLEDVD